MRMKVLQAMAAGRAVVTTPLGAAGLGDEHELPLMIGRDAAELAAAAVTLLADAPARLELGRRARAYVQQQFGPDAVATRLEAIYAEAVERKRAERR
jgi:glycosyltransferase involved in cell wall biosynthesis